MKVAKGQHEVGGPGWADIEVAGTQRSFMERAEAVLLRGNPGVNSPNQDAYTQAIRIDD